MPQNSTNLVTAENANHLKCHINGMVALPWVKWVTFMQIEAAMSHFDYETEQVKTIVFAYIKENRGIFYEA